MPSCIHCGDSFGNGDPEMEHAGTCRVMNGDYSPSFRDEIRVLIDDTHMNDDELKRKLHDISLDSHRDMKVIVVGGGKPTRVSPLESISHPTIDDCIVTHTVDTTPTDMTMTVYPTIDFVEDTELKIRMEEKKKKSKPWNNKVKKHNPKWMW